MRDRKLPQNAAALATMLAYMHVPFRAAVRGDRNPHLNPKPRRPDSEERIAAAQAKRERKAAKRIAGL